MSEQLTEKTVQLDTPIKRGKTEITEIVLRKPQSGALRGTRLQAIMDMDVGRDDDCHPADLHADPDRAGNGGAGPRRSHRAVG